MEQMKARIKTLQEREQIKADMEKTKAKTEQVKAFMEQFTYVKPRKEKIEQTRPAMEQRMAKTGQMKPAMEQSKPPTSDLSKGKAISHMLKNCNTSETAKKLTYDLLSQHYTPQYMATHTVSQPSQKKQPIPTGELISIIGVVQHYFPDTPEKEIKDYMRTKFRNANPSTKEALGKRSATKRKRNEPVSGTHREVREGFRQTTLDQLWSATKRKINEPVSDTHREVREEESCQPNKKRKHESSSDGSPKTTGKGLLKELSSKHVKAYEEALAGGKHAVNQCRVMLVGPEGAGKSNILKTLLSREFESEHIETNAMEIAINKLKQWQPYIVKSEYEEKTAEYIVKTVNEETRSAPGKQQSVQTDKDDRDGERQPEKELDQETEIPPSLREAIIKQQNSNEQKSPELSFWDSGGQGVFYNTLKTFLSRRCVYIIAMDMTKGLAVKTWRRTRYGQDVIDKGCPQTVREHFDYWLRCLQTFPSSTESSKDQASPSIIIVCTHKDKCPEIQAKKYVGDLRKLIEDEKYGDEIPRIFVISNKDRDDQDTLELKKSIIEFAMDKRKEYIIPLKWINFKEKLLQSADKNLPIKTWKEAKAIAQKLGITEETQIEAALLFYHEVGDLLFFNERSLKDFIVTHPQWLIDQIRKVITVPNYHDKTPGNFSRLWVTLDNDGVLHESILKAVWREEARTQLVTLMKKVGLLLDIPPHYIYNQAKEADREKRYLVPCLLPLWEPDFCDQKVLLLVPPKRFMPVGLTSRLLAGLVNEDKWKVEEKIYGNAAVFYPEGGKSSVVICIFQRDDHLELHGTQVDDQCNDQFPKALKKILRRLKVITTTVCLLQKFSIRMYCPDCLQKGLRCEIDVDEKAGKIKDKILHNTHKCTTQHISCWFKIAHERKKVASAPEASTQDRERQRNPALDWEKPKNEFDRLRKELEGKTVKRSRIALMDTGVLTTHPDLQDTIEDSKNCIGKKDKEDVFHPYGQEERDLQVDSSNHGTMSAGILVHNAGTENIQIHNLKVMTKNGGDGGLGLEPVSQAVEYIKDWDDRNEKKKVDIVLITLGTPKEDGDTKRILSDLEEDKILICSASNEGKTTNDSILYPAKYGVSIVVGSCDQHCERCPHSAVGRQLDFLFHGSKVQSTSSKYEQNGDHRYATKAGTSFAAPLCAAFVALLLGFIEVNITDCAGHDGQYWRKFFTNTTRMRDLIQGFCNGYHDHKDGFGVPDFSLVTKTRIQDYIQRKYNS